jgi:RHS repeat-associated protein
MIAASNITPTNNTTLGQKQYTGSNHLGNVLVTFTNRKLPVDANNDQVIDGYLPDVISANDYAPFGSLLTERTFKKGTYPNTFNGKRDDSELNMQDYGMRMYSPQERIFPSRDPISFKYPYLSPYQFASNSPILGVDEDGLELAFGLDGGITIGYIKKANNKWVLGIVNKQLSMAISGNPFGPNSSSMAKTTVNFGEAGKITSVQGQYSSATNLTNNGDPATTDPTFTNKMTIEFETETKKTTIIRSGSGDIGKEFNDPTIRVATDNIDAAKDLTTKVEIEEKPKEQDVLKVEIPKESKGTGGYKAAEPAKQKPLIGAEDRKAGMKLAQKKVFGK